MVNRQQEVRDRIYQFFLGTMQFLVHMLTKIGFTPNLVTLLAVGINIFAAALITQHALIAAGIAWFIAGILDLLDGLMARSLNKATSYGTFLDSTMDRLSDGIVFSAIIYLFALSDDPVMAALTALALLGSLMTSYARARAESLGVACKGGWGSRFERVLLIGAGLLLNILPIAIIILCALGFITVVQRMLETKRALDC